MPAPKGNKYALGLTNSGRPPIYNSADELKNKCIEYFEECKNLKEKVTITGLALYLGFCSRSSLDDYVKKEEFSYIVKRAKLVVENSYENSGQTIDIFALKNMSWKDKQEIENTGSVEIKTIKFKKYENE